MKRSAFVCRVLVCLLLGAVTAAAVAWVIAWRTPVFAVAIFRDFLSYAPEERDADWSIRVWQVRGAAVGFAWEKSASDLPIAGKAPRWTRIWLHEASQELSDFRYAYVTGWPALSFGCEVSFADDKNYPGFLLPVETRPSLGGITLGPRMMAAYPGARNKLLSRVLPLRPIWSGLALNTLVYGAGWMFVVFGPWGWRSLRRRRRVRRGRCAACGYDLRGGGGAGERCPECGDGSGAGAGSDVDEM